MRKLLPLLTCVMLVLSMWAGVAQAGESAACAETLQMKMPVAMPMGAGCDQAPADADHGHPQHHAACHGCHMTAPGDVGHVIASTPVDPAYGAGEQSSLYDRDSERRRRPPQA